MSKPKPKSKTAPQPLSLWEEYVRFQQSRTLHTSLDADTVRERLQMFDGQTRDDGCFVGKGRYIVEAGDDPATLRLHHQREGDDWFNSAQAHLTLVDAADGTAVHIRLRVSLSHIFIFLLGTVGVVVLLLLAAQQGMTTENSGFIYGTLLLLPTVGIFFVWRTFADRNRLLREIHQAIQPQKRTSAAS